MSPQSVSFCKDETPHLLIVEGKDDCNGIYQIAAKHGFQNTFGIWEGGSDVGALERFGRVLLSSKSRPQVLGIVLDCDADDEGNITGPIRRWAQVKSRLEKFAYALPDAPLPHGTIIDGPEGYPKVGIWLMPDNQTEGMFEDFLLPLLTNEASSFARESVTEAKKRQIAKFKDVHFSKAVAHTYLAWQDEPGRPLGIAIKAKMFDVEGEKAKTFVDWLRTLFAD